MDQNMTPHKAFWHALLTVGLGVLLVASLLLYLGEHSELKGHNELWPVLAFVFLVTAIILVPVVYRRYMKGPRPLLTPQQHRAQAAWQAVAAIVYFGIHWAQPGENRMSKWAWMIVGIWLASALNHLRQAYEKAGKSSPIQ